MATTRNLKEAAHGLKTTSSAKTKGPSCALAAKSCSACGGHGLQIRVKGALAVAEVCSCVQQCLACFGKTRIVVDNVSRPCRTPSPVRMANLITGAGIPARYAKASIEQFSNFSGNGKEITTQIQRWLKTPQPHVGRGVLIGGPVGVGKTYLLAGIAKALALRGLTVRFVDFFHLLNELKAAYANDQSDDAVLAPLINCDVLIIDELGKGRNSDWEMTILDNLVTGRYNQSKIIVGSTNYQLKAGAKAHDVFNIELDSGTQASRSGFSPDSFESLETRVGKRIFSRLCQMTTFLEMSGKDFRRTSKDRSNEVEVKT